MRNGEAVSGQTAKRTSVKALINTKSSSERSQEITSSRAANDNDHYDNGGVPKIETYYSPKEKQP